MNVTILRFDTLDSTNTEAANHARNGAEEGLCIIAREQSAGRGRYGRTWVSEKDSGLYFSIVLRPEIDIKNLPLITLMTGVAAYDTLTEIGLNADIKWVNDLIVNEKKIGGILAETVDTPTGLAVIVGIGINLTSRNFPDEIADTATSIEAENGKRLAPNDLADILTRYLVYFYDLFNQQDGASQILTEWRKRSSYFSGKRVRVALSDKTIEGVTDGLEENGALRIVTGEGSICIIQAGDVMQLRSVRG